MNLIYIAGTGHSGSTLLCLLFGQNEQVFAGGHLHAFRKLFTDAQGRRCGCGSSVNSCEFWNAVKGKLKEAGITMPGKQPSAAEFHLFYRYILEASETSVICDSSLNRYHHKFLADAGFARIFLVHLVRDARAVYYSQIRKHSRSLRAPVSWAVINAETYLRHHGKPYYALVRYEDLVREPDAVMCDLGNKASEYFGDDRLRYEPGRRLSFANHIFRANSMRHQKTPEIKLDAEYLRAVTPFDWGVSTAVAAPLLLRFGYPLGRRPA